MCWSTEVSAVAALLTWGVVAYLYQRNYSPRDRWYATYLLTYTGTQLVDIALWTINAKTPLRACPSLAGQMSLKFPSGPDADQATQFGLSKFVIPIVVAGQYAVQASYPSERLKSFRPLIITFLSVIPFGGMVYEFACSDITHASWPAMHETLRWGGHTAPTPQVLVVVAITSATFYALIPERRVAWAHLLTFWSVVSFLWMTEGTLALGSKWCTYCLVFSTVYLSDPLWGPGPSMGETKTPEKAAQRSQYHALRGSASASGSVAPTKWSEEELKNFNGGSSWSLTAFSVFAALGAAYIIGR